MLDDMIDTGGSVANGAAALGRDILRLPVRIGVPTDVYGISDVLRDPAYATSVGLLLWGNKNQSHKSWKSGIFGGAVRRMALQLGRLFR